MSERDYQRPPPPPEPDTERDADEDDGQLTIDQFPEWDGVGPVPFGVIPY